MQNVFLHTLQLHEICALYYTVDAFVASSKYRLSTVPVFNLHSCKSHSH